MAAGVCGRDGVEGYFRRCEGSSRSPYSLQPVFLSSSTPSPCRTPRGPPDTPPPRSSLPLCPFHSVLKGGFCARESLDIISFGEQPPWQGLLVLTHENICHISSRGRVFQPQVKGPASSLLFPLDNIPKLVLPSE